MPQNHFHSLRRLLLSPQAWRMRLAFAIGALLVGLVSTGFGIASLHANQLFFKMAEQAPLAPLVVTPLGLVLVTWLARRFFPGSEGSGINQIIAALEMRTKSRVVSLKLAAGKILLTLIGQSCGASIGREGPTVHVAASIMYSMRHFARFPPDYMARAMLLAGSAAGISAAFNTPLAGIVFAIEEISRAFSAHIAGIVTLAVIFSALVAMALTGQNSYFGTDSVASVDALGDWAAVLLCGTLAGLAGGLFALLVVKGSRWLAPVVATNPLSVAFLCGCVLVTTGAMTDYQVMGSGFDIAKSLVIDSAETDPLYPMFKFIASLASYLSGIPGGIFAPALSTGAGIGVDLHRMIPVSSLELMVLLGMVGYFAGAVKSPITGFVIVMEMTNDQYTLLALMATAMIGYGASYLISPYPLYHSLAQLFLEKQEHQSQQENQDQQNQARQRPASS
ncbi:H(+)/Cl(-) exchange transporter ClcA [Thiorhodovibrio winogradskyi]|uniref:H(+)/Cl(-) exchange transporter ClcA n=1 Tax=Thiorhodovibrio winogradskyi TaxID=77007 RepID=A0ABZ0S8Z9_9GAMM|nr:chloride channel protein [Thiorhodovibrio winogradskyi]